MSRSLAASVAMLAILASANNSAAQTSAAPQKTNLEIRITSGAFVPTGSQRSALDNAQATAAQVSWVIRRSLAITGTFAWARSRDVAMATTPKLDVFSSDVGLEARTSEWRQGRSLSFSPFVGLGAGARSYNYRKLDVDATHNIAGYGAIGGELGVRRVGLRLEVRDYVTGFRPLVGAGTSQARNDVVVMAGLRIKKRSASHN